MKTTLYEKLKEVANRHPDAVALDALNRSPLSYRMLVEQIENGVKKLNSFGVNRSDRVAMVMSNGPDMAIAFLAVASAATCAPLNPAYHAKDYDFYLSDLDARALIVEDGLDSAAEKVALQKKIPIIRLTPQLKDSAGIFTLKLPSKITHGRQHCGMAEPEDMALVLHTSGTTARPKMIPLTQQNLCIGADNVISSLQLGPADRCLNVMPLFHIAGLVGILLSSLFCGASVVCTPGFRAASFFEWMRTLQPTWYWAVPTMQQAILEQSKDNHEVIESCPLRMIRSSSSALPPIVIEQLESVYKAPVLETYGMTEASQQVCSNRLSPGKRKYGSVGIAAGPEVKVMDERGNFLSADEVGEIVIRGANVILSYLNNQTANTESFRNGWLRTGDVGRIDAEGYIFLHGRSKEIINRGGEKISPREIDEALLEHAQIFQAAAFAVAHPTLGEDISAAVVLRKGASVNEHEIREFAFERLADFKVPTQIVIVDSIPTGATGKVQRISLADKLTEQLKREFAAPAGELEKMAAKAFATVLGISLIGRYDNFFALGGDSLRGTQLVSRIRSLLKVDLPVTALFRKPTIIELSAEIARLHDEIKTTRLDDIVTEIERLSEEQAARLLAAELNKKI